VSAVDTNQKRRRLNASRSEGGELPRRTPAQRIDCFLRMNVSVEIPAFILWVANS
jgi:hypothetical protein